MKPLINTHCGIVDFNIGKELEQAGIEIHGCARNRGRVKYSLVGKLGNWDFVRGDCEWLAEAPEGKGLPFGVAKALYHLKVKPGNNLSTGYWWLIKPDSRYLAPIGGFDKNKEYKTIDKYKITSQKGLDKFASRVKRLI